MSNKFSARPSEMLGLSCDIQSFYLDRACWLFGSQLDSQIEVATSKAKNDTARRTAAQQIFNKAMSQGTVAGVEQGAKKYRDPALM